MNEYRLESQYNFIKVLIIEDILYNRRSITKEFRDIDCFVLSANSGNEALEKVKRYSPHIVTFSHDLSDMTIKTLVMEVINCADREETKLLLLSSRENTDFYQRDLSNMIDGVVTLPASLEELQTTVSTLLS